MKNKLFLTVALAAACTAAAAQNLNPTVEVTNTYEGDLTGLEKPEQLLSVPDSVTRFNLDFDYAVFENPYRGAYEFQPYMVQLRPLPMPSGEKRLFLKAGAGYSLHPELQLLWTPVSTKSWQLHVFADHRSYMGYTRGISPQRQEDGSTVFTDDGSRTGCGDLDTRAGVSGRWMWGGGQVEGSVAYRNLLAQHEDQLNRLDHALSGEVRVRALDTPETDFYYNFGVRYTYRTEDVEALGAWAGAHRELGFGQHRFDVDGSFGPTLSFGRPRVDVGAVVLNHQSTMGTGQDFFTGNVHLTPRLLFELGTWRFDLGARVSVLFHSKETDGNYLRRSAFLFPDARADWYILDERLVFQAEAVGRDHVNGYFDMVDRHHFVRMGDFPLDNSVELVNTSVGFRGRLFSRLQYDLKGGYARWKGLLLETWDGSPFPVFTALQDPTNAFFGKLSLGWQNDFLKAETRMQYTWTDVSQDRVFAPADFTGTARVLYNWGWRIEAGASVQWSTARFAWAGNQYYRIPGFADLGLEGAFALNRQWGIWAKVGNLLGQTIQLYPLHAENGIYFTLGFRLTM